MSLYTIWTEPIKYPVVGYTIGYKSVKDVKYAVASLEKILFYQIMSGLWKNNQVEKLVSCEGFSIYKINSMLT